MKRTKHSRGNIARDRKMRRRREQRGGFKCCNCRTQVFLHAHMGTANRNHCNLCLWSKHVDEKKGDRGATCQAGMRPVGLTFRIESRGRRGELMLIHACSGCPRISINRIAADDIDHEILEVFKQSLHLEGNLRRKILGAGIWPAVRSDSRSVCQQLFGTGAACP